MNGNIHYNKLNYIKLIGGTKRKFSGTEEQKEGLRDEELIKKQKSETEIRKNVKEQYEEIIKKVNIFQEAYKKDINNFEGDDNVTSEIYVDRSEFAMAATINILKIYGFKSLYFEKPLTVYDLLTENTYNREQIEGLPFSQLDKGDEVTNPLGLFKGYQIYDNGTSAYIWVMSFKDTQPTYIEHNKNYEMVITKGNSDMECLIISPDTFMYDISYTVSNLPKIIPYLKEKNIPIYLFYQDENMYPDDIEVPNILQKFIIKYKLVYQS